MAKNLRSSVKGAAHGGLMYLNELREGSSGPIVVMVCRKWDVTSVNGRYMSTDYIVSDKNGNIFHCVARNNIAHYFFDKLNEGGLYSIRNFAVRPINEYRVLKDIPYVIDLHGSTVVRKVEDDICGFERHPFQLTPFEDLKPTENKYFVDVIGYTTSVGEQSVKSTGARTVEFNLSNERKRQVRVTLWGTLGDAMIKKKRDNPDVYSLILTSMTAKYYNSALCLSSSSSTLLIDSGDVPALNTFKSSLSCIHTDDYIRPITEDVAVVNTLHELLDWSRESSNKKQSVVFKNTVEITSIRTKNSWYLFTCTGSKCRKGITRDDGYFKCKACNTRVDYPRTRFRIQADVTDGTMSTVVVLFDEAAEKLVKRTAKSLVEEQQKDTSLDAPILPPALESLIGTKHIFEIKSHTYYHFGDYESFNCAKVVGPTIETDVSQVFPIKPTENITTINSCSSSLLKRDASGDTPSKERVRKLRKFCIQDSDGEDLDVKDSELKDDGVEGVGETTNSEDCKDTKKKRLPKVSELDNDGVEEKEEIQNEL